MIDMHFERENYICDQITLSMVNNTNMFKAECVFFDELNKQCLTNILSLILDGIK